MNDKTLVAYVSKGGATEEAASVIANVLQEKHGLAVDLANLKKEKPQNLNEYSNVVVGSGVRIGKHYKEFLKFLENDFSGKKVALFILSLEAGNPKSYSDAFTKYIKNTLQKYPRVKPVEAEAFGGRMHILGKTVADKFNAEKVKAWADKLGGKLKG